MRASFRVVVNGIAADKSLRQVADALAPKFKQPASRLIPVLERRGFVLKRRLDLDTARRYARVLKAAGCACAVEPEDPPPPPPRLAWAERAALVLEAPGVRGLAARWRAAPRRHQVYALALVTLAGAGIALAAVLVFGSTPPAPPPPAPRASLGPSKAQLSSLAINLFVERVQQGKAGSACEAYRNVRVGRAQAGTVRAAGGTLPALLVQLEFDCVNMSLGPTPRPASRWMAFGYDRKAGTYPCFASGDQRAARAGVQRCGFRPL